jgi:hypothetical protein
MRIVGEYVSMLDDPGSFRRDPSDKQNDPRISEMMAVGIKPAAKTLRFDRADLTGMVAKTEGVALLGDGSLALINDDDFGITGGRTQIVVVKGTGIVRR